MQSSPHRLLGWALSFSLASASCTLVNSRAGLARDDDSATDGADAFDDGTTDGQDGQGSTSTDGGAPRDGNQGGQGDGEDMGDAGKEPATDAGGGGANSDGNGDGNSEMPMELVLYSDLVEPRGITIDGHNVCWVAGEPRSIYCAPKDGSGPISDITLPSDREKLAGAFDIVFDDQYLYWSNGSYNELVRRPRSGGTPSAYFTGSGTLAYIALLDGFVFASDYRGPTISGNIMRGPHGTDINGVGQSMVIYPDEAGASGVAIVGEVVYYGTHDVLAYGHHFGNDHLLQRVPAGGSVQGVAVDGKLDAYFLVNNQRLYKLVRNTVTPVLLYEAEVPFGESDVALDDEWVYWSERDLGLIKRARR